MNENNEDVDLAALLAKNRDERETIRWLKRRQKNRTYYLEHKGVIKERSLKNYYLKREEKEQAEKIQGMGTEQSAERIGRYVILVFWASCIFAGMAVAVWLSNKQKKPDALSLNQGNKESDVEEGNSSSFPFEKPQAKYWGLG